MENIFRLNGMDMIYGKRTIKSVIINLMGWTIFGPIVRKITENKISKNTKLSRIKNMTAMLCQQISTEYADVFTLK